MCVWIYILYNIAIRYIHIKLLAISRVDFLTSTTIGVLCLVYSNFYIKKGFSTSVNIRLQ